MVVEQIVRPTGLVDPEVMVRPTKGQIDNLMDEISGVIADDGRVLVTTLTKKMAEDLTDYLVEQGVRVRYLHSEVDTIQRIELLRGLRMGEFDVLVGINLLREGLDLPEVQLVCILDADKEGFLRSETSLVQTIGRAARNVDGRVIMYADQMTPSMQAAISETNRRRGLQVAYNEANGIEPETIRKAVTDILSLIRPERGDRAGAGPGSAQASTRGGAADPGAGRAARGPAASPDRHPRRGDARGIVRPPLRVRGPAPRRDQGPSARAPRDGLTDGSTRHPSRHRASSGVRWSVCGSRRGGQSIRRAISGRPGSG